MNDIVSRTLNTVAANTLARTTTPYAVRNQAAQLKDNLQRATSSAQELQRLDVKWNNGYASGETTAARHRVGDLVGQRDVFETYLKDQTTSLGTSPSQKEYASVTMKKLLGNC